jgi:hypothetical protein
MSRSSFLSFCMVAALIVVDSVHAGSGSAPSAPVPPADPAAKATRASKPDAPPVAEAPTPPPAPAATPAPAAVPAPAPPATQVVGASDRELQAIRQRGAEAKSEAQAAAEPKMSVAARDVEKKVEIKGEVEVAARLAKEFGLEQEAMVAEKQALGATWGELMVAHTLQANSQTPITVQQVLGLRAEGRGWGEIAAGLGFDVAQAVRAVENEAKVIVGKGKVDGKPAVIVGSKLDTKPKTSTAAGVGLPTPRHKPGS